MVEDLEVEVLVEWACGMAGSAGERVRLRLEREDVVVLDLVGGEIRWSTGEE